MLFIGYTSGLSRNPPGFYVDESAIAYNAYLVSRTGAGEFGSRFPLYFQVFTAGFTQYVNPTQVYLLAFVFRFLPPISIFEMKKILHKPEVSARA